MMEITQIASIVAVIAGAYVLGSIPFGLVLTRLAGLGDVRAQGSGNIGATNVLRIGGKKLALATLLLDGIKGLVAVKLAIYFVSYEAGLLAGAFSVIGHNFPVWLKFKGGKGVATTFFVILAIAPLLALIAFALWVITFAITKISSLSALVVAVTLPAASLFLAPSAACALIVFLSFMLIVRHKANIRRLLKGEEPRFSSKIGGR